MTWAKLDDRFHENRKVKRAWRLAPASIGLHVMAITYCSGHETDGHVDIEFVEEKVPKDRERERLVAALLTAGLWERVDGGWQIHDFLTFNPSREQLDEKRRAKSDAGKKGAAARWGDNSHQPPAMAPVIAGANGTAMPSDAPDPTRTLKPPLPPTGGRSRDRDLYDQQVKAFATSLLPDVAPDDATQAVRSVLGSLRLQDVQTMSADDVRQRAVRWLPEAALTDEQRRFIRGLGEKVVHLNAGAEPAA